MHTRSASFAHYLFNILNFLATLLSIKKNPWSAVDLLPFFFLFTYNRPLDKAFRAALGSILPKQQLYDPAQRRLRGLSKLSTGVPPPRCVSGGQTVLPVFECQLFYGSPRLHYACRTTPPPPSTRDSRYCNVMVFGWNKRFRLRFGR